MDKQELIGKYEDELKDVQLKFGANFKTKVYEDLIEDLKQLDEHQEPVVPQFLADWIFKAQLVNDFSLCIALEYTTIKLYADNSEEILKWLEIRKNQETFALAWVNGYEVEKDKRYRVKVKGVYFNTCLIFEKENKKWLFSSFFEINHQTIHHTRKELEQAGFGWVFDCPGMEVEEVAE